MGLYLLYRVLRNFPQEKYFQGLEFSLDVSIYVKKIKQELLEKILTCFSTSSFLP